MKGKKRVDELEVMGTLSITTDSVEYLFISVTYFPKGSFVFSRNSFFLMGKSEYSNYK